MILIHQPSSGVQGQQTDIQIVADETKWIRHHLNELLADATGKSIEQIDKDTERDNYMGCSIDFDDEKFTMSPEFSKAVRKVFCDWYHDGLIYRGKRIVNWCPQCRTAISDDEAEYHDEKGHLWYLRYPLVEPVDGIEYITVATTRPETMTASSLARTSVLRTGSTFCSFFRSSARVPSIVAGGSQPMRTAFPRATNTRGFSLAASSCSCWVRSTRWSLQR